MTYTPMPITDQSAERFYDLEGLAACDVSMCRRFEKAIREALDLLNAGRSLAAEMKLQAALKEE